MGNNNNNVQCVAFIQKKTYNLIKNKIANQNLTSRTCNTGSLYCPTFCILKRDFDEFLNLVNYCTNKNRTESQFIKIIQGVLGLPNNWGVYNVFITFSIEKSNLYKPLYQSEGEIVAAQYKNPTKLPSNIDADKLAQNIQQNKFHVISISKKLTSPFIGTGRTLVTYKGKLNKNIKNALKSLYQYNKNNNFNGQGFSEYVIPENVKMNDVIYYDSVHNYCSQGLGYLQLNS